MTNDALRNLYTHAQTSKPYKRKTMPNHVTNNHYAIADVINRMIDSATVTLGGVVGGTYGDHHQAQVSFPSNVAPIFSAIKQNFSILFLAQ